MKKYSGVQITLHWLILLLIITACATMEFRDIFPHDSAGRYWMGITHYSCGLTVMILMLVRIAVRMFILPPPVCPPLPRWQARTAAAVHGCLYALFIVLPAMGLLSLYSGQKEWAFFFINMPVSAVKDMQWQHNFKEIHELLASAGYFIVGLHAAAALLHHYLWHDNTLQRMMPGK
ncbi:cytochrome b/b6 domain-containing protein [Enterobacter hormaechei]|nr:cytochrome b/b6 domain-containing protein [Klebsiella variicola]ELD3473123.1 cytochrome b/b6 domain-containing protein [Enterobacter hormaechei]ELD3486685.1 cytochrome b/b6 domain-containing protein [Enterobacter hormaechei]KJX14649.1 hydrogenase [Enterobacter hormaechei subsp. xiangfangensis]HCT5211402.1 cytochrome b/b6 domain-containing protein [Enterobacter hormaechei]